jgi:hypothetical protein
MQHASSRVCRGVSSVDSKVDVSHFGFIPTTNVVFLRVQSPGDFLIVVTHGLAHVAAKRMDCDNDPAVTHAMYSMMRQLAGKLFLGYGSFSDMTAVISEIW